MPCGAPGCDPIPGTPSPVPQPWYPIPGTPSPVPHPQYPSSPAARHSSLSPGSAFWGDFTQLQPGSEAMNPLGCSSTPRVARRLCCAHRNRCNQRRRAPASGATWAPLLCGDPQDQSSLCRPFSTAQKQVHPELVLLRSPESGSPGQDISHRWVLALGLTSFNASVLRCTKHQFSWILNKTPIIAWFRENCTNCVRVPRAEVSHHQQIPSPCPMPAQRVTHPQDMGAAVLLQDATKPLALLQLLSRQTCSPGAAQTDEHPPAALVVRNN